MNDKDVLSEMGHLMQLCEAKQWKLSSEKFNGLKEVLFQYGTSIKNFEDADRAVNITASFYYNVGSANTDNDLGLEIFREMCQIAENGTPFIASRCCMLAYQLYAASSISSEEALSVANHLGSRFPNAEISECLANLSVLCSRRDEFP